MKILFYICFLTLFSNAVCAQVQANPQIQRVKNSNTIDSKIQNPCALEYSKIPLINGLKLNFSYEGVKETYPEIEDNEHFQKTYLTTKEGLAMFLENEISNPENKQFVQQLSLNIQEEKLNTVNIIYNSNVTWKSLDEMLESFSETLSADKKHWEIINEKSASLKCKDFVMYCNYLTEHYDKPYISMSFGIVSQ